MNQPYAPLPDRIKAAVIDSIIIIAVMYGVSILFGQFEEVPGSLRIAAFVVIFLLYDPLFTSFYGGTMGHSYIGIAVRKDDDSNTNISFIKAVLRFVVKATLGWISLITTTGNPKRKALHDFVADSVVIREDVE